MIAQPVRTQLTFQFLVAVLAFAALGVFVIGTLRQRAGTWTIGYHGSSESKGSGLFD